VNFKVVVDAVNSSGSIIVPNLLKALDIEVIELFCDQTKGFPHTPEPLTENLTELINEVKNQKANLGLAIDPDSDRLVIIGENGEAIGEENTIVLSVFAILNNLKNSNLQTNINIVVNGSTTSMVEKVADKFGSKVIRSAVGEINVVEMMKLYNAIIGGEGSGGVILPELHYSRDAVIGIALILSLIYNQKKSVNAIVEDLGKSIMKKDKMEFTGSLDSIITKIEKEFNGNEIIIGDGIKIYTNKYEWVQLRKSNTEPIIRIIAESDNKETTDKLMKKVKNILSESL
jgi:phosphomannomutase